MVEQQLINEPNEKPLVKQKGGYKQIEPRWKPGQSGNPLGRPVNSVTALLKDTDELTNKQIAQIIIAKVLAGDHQFLETYLNRREGKVSDHLKLEGDIPVSIVFVRVDKE